MKFSVAILARAQSDVDQIYDWLNKRSPSGALRWYAAFCEAIRELQEDAGRFPIASETASLSVEVREELFRTRRGRRYRLLFTIIDQQVRILRVRGPGQPPVESVDVGDKS